MFLYYLVMFKINQKNKNNQLNIIIVVWIIVKCLKSLLNKKNKYYFIEIFKLSFVIAKWCENNK